MTCRHAGPPPSSSSNPAELARAITPATGANEKAAGGDGVYGGQRKETSQ
jgi:hypothetical protein